MSLPLISIIIPTYNRAHFIGDALDAIIGQTYTNWECIVVDDGSEDNTSELMIRYGKRDARISYVQRPRAYVKGVNACRNYGFSISKGDYIAFCDDDDFWLPNKLQLQIAIFLKYKDVGLVTGNIEFVNADGKRTNRVITQTHNHGYVFKDFLFKNRVSMITPVVKREVFDTVGLFNTDFKIFEDWEFWIRVSYYYKFYALTDVLACVRKHETNTSRVVTLAPLEQYLRYRKLIKSIRKWGEGRFTKGDIKLVEFIETKKYIRIIKNHCKGIKNKSFFVLKIFEYNLYDGLRLSYLLFIYLIHGKNRLKKQKNLYLN